MTNRSSGGNGGFRFQRILLVYILDEPLVIDDNITMYKNLSIPAGSLSLFVCYNWKYNTR